jgi:hypothetical protein
LEPDYQWLGKVEAVKRAASLPTPGGLRLRRDRSAGTDENRARGRSSSAIRLFASGDARVLLRQIRAGTLLFELASLFFRLSRD